jgi:putative tryptophan/tyrosine transport system substrate-binding protein
MAPPSALAQAAERMRRIRLLMSFEADEPEAHARRTAFVQGLQKLRAATSRLTPGGPRMMPDRDRRYSAGLVALAPDVILATGSRGVAALQQVTHSVLILFANVIDAVGAGLVASLGRPGGNTTGFTAFEYGLAGR